MKGKGFQVILFDKHNYHTVQPLLYQVATSALEPDSIAGPVRDIFTGYDDFYFRMLKVLAVDPENNLVSTAAGDLKYDHLIFANGTKVNYFGNDQARDNCFPLKFIKDALNFRSQWFQALERAILTKEGDMKKSLMTVVMVGGGPTGVEIKGNLATIGRGKAVADLSKNLHFHGRPAWWIWLFIHITYLVSFRNRLLVMANWIWNYFTFQKGNRLIIRPFIRPGDKISEEIFAGNEKDY